MPCRKKVAAVILSLGNTDVLPVHFQDIIVGQACMARSAGNLMELGGGRKSEPSMGGEIMK